jgi:hypothetical protein
VRPFSTPDELAAIASAAIVATLTSVALRLAPSASTG